MENNNLDNNSNDSLTLLIHWCLLFGSIAGGVYIFEKLLFGVF